MTITDELFWTSARAGIDEQGSASIYVSQDRYVYYSGFDLRAALKAAAPAIRKAALEEAAKVADEYHERAVDWAKTIRGLEELVTTTDSSRIAAAIRALADKEGT